MNSCLRLSGFVRDVPDADLTPRRYPLPQSRECAMESDKVRFASQPAEESIKSVIQRRSAVPVIAHTGVNKENTVQILRLFRGVIPHALKNDGVTRVLEMCGTPSNRRPSSR